MMRWSLGSCWCMPREVLHKNLHGVWDALSNYVRFSLGKTEASTSRGSQPSEFGCPCFTYLASSSLAGFSGAHPGAGTLIHRGADSRMELHERFSL